MSSLHSRSSISASFIYFDQPRSHIKSYKVLIFGQWKRGRTAEEVDEAGMSADHLRLLEGKGLCWSWP